jgi:RNA polymerase sigma-70 factor (ECF subfamily)
MTSTVTALRIARAADAEPDDGTIAAAARGERWAQAAVLDRYAQPVWALVCRVLGRAGRGHLADDISQDALLAVLRSLTRYRPQVPSRFGAWVLTIAARTAITEIRRRRELLPMVAEFEIAADDDSTLRAGDPERRAESRAIERAIAIAVDGLPPEFRAAFVLRAYHELEYAEIATALGIDIGTVKSRLWRARAQLQAALDEVRHG